MLKKVADFWYAINTCDDEIVQLREVWMDPYTASDIWLVRGKTRDVLIDTGSGIVTPVPIVSAIAGNSVLAVACNSFYDHAGGLHFFDEQACHRLDAALIRAPTVESSLVATYIRDENFTAYPHADFEPMTHRMQGAAPTTLFEDEHVIDLGNRQLEVLSVPGMTPGSIAIWERDSGSLFTCDTVYDDPLERPFGPRDPDAFAHSLDRLRALPVKTGYGGHFGRFSPQRMSVLIDRYFDRDAPHR